MGYNDKGKQKKEEAVKQDAAGKKSKNENPAGLYGPAGLTKKRSNLFCDLAFLDLQCGLACTLAQVEEFCPSGLAVFHHGNTFNVG